MPNKSLSRSSLLSFEKYSSLLVGNEAYEPPSDDFELLETQILSTGTSSITFSNLNATYGSTYRHLQLRAVSRTNRTGADSDPILLRFNLDTGNNYSRHGLIGYLGSTVVSNGGGSQNSIYLTENTAVDQNASGIFGTLIADILDPFRTNKNKTVKAFSGMYASGWQSIELRGGAWINTAAITTITLAPLIGTNFVAGSRFSLYGIRNS